MNGEAGGLGWAQRTGRRDVAALRAVVLSAVEDAPEHKVEAWLVRFGVSAQGVLLSALTSGQLLCQMLLFLFIGMQAFTDSAPDAVRAATNSLLVAAAGVATNLLERRRGAPAAEADLGGDGPLRQARSEARFSFSLDEDVCALVSRAAGLRAADRERPRQPGRRAAGRRPRVPARPGGLLSLRTTAPAAPLGAPGTHSPGWALLGAIPLQDPAHCRSGGPGAAVARSRVLMMGETA